MISIKDFLEAINYQITGGDEYQWDCFGKHARFLDSCGREDWNASIVFDTVTQEVYIAEVFDNKLNLQYRLINPNFKVELEKEAKFRGVDLNIAYDNHKFTDLETDEDWLEKATAIAAGEQYDHRVSIPLDIPNDELLKICLAAHAEDLTLNQFVEKALQAKIDEMKAKGLLKDEE